MAPDSSVLPPLTEEQKIRYLADAIVPALQNLESAHKRNPRSIAEAAARALLAGDQPIRMAFLARAFNALADLTAGIEEFDLGDAAGAASDYQVLLRALETPDSLRALQKADPLAAARVRGLFARSRLLEEEGEPLTADQVAAVLHISRQAVEKRRRTQKLLGLDTGRRGYLYPSWQFSSDGVLPGIADVLANVGVRDPWMQLAFFLNGNLRLNGETPLAELRRGHLDAVLRAARSYGEQGAA